MLVVTTFSEDDFIVEIMLGVLVSDIFYEYMVIVDGKAVFEVDIQFMMVFDGSVKFNVAFGLCMKYAD